MCIRVRARRFDGFRRRDGIAGRQGRAGRGTRLRRCAGYRALCRLRRRDAGPCGSLPVRGFRTRRRHQESGRAAFAVRRPGRPLRLPAAMGFAMAVPGPARGGHQEAGRAAFAVHRPGRPLRLPAAMGFAMAGPPVRCGAGIVSGGGRGVAGVASCFLRSLSCDDALDASSGVGFRGRAECSKRVLGRRGRGGGRCDAHGLVGRQLLTLAGCSSVRGHVQAHGFPPLRE